MVIEVEGRMIFNNIICEKCDTKLSASDDKYNSLRCRVCGAFYNLSHDEIEGNEIKRIYNFQEFRCIYSFGLERCDNKCMASEMYCESHISDECFDSVKNHIDYLNRRLEITQRTLERMEESKKLILIQKVSGTYEEDSALREDET